MLRRGQLTDAEYRLAVGERPPAREARDGGAPGVSPEPAGIEPLPELDAAPAGGDTIEVDSPGDTTGPSPEPE
jgi:hypothetical protein